MTGPRPETAEDRLRALQAKGTGSAEDRLRALQAKGTGSAEEVKAAAPAKPAFVDQLRKGAGFAGALTDAATFGLGGLIADVRMAADPYAPGGFREAFAQNRADRRANKARLTGPELVGATVAGVVANPFGTLLRAPQGAGLLMRGAAAAGDAAIQGGVTAGAEGLDALTPEGVRGALESAGSGAMGAVVGTGLLRGGISVGRGVNTLARVAAAPTLGAARLARQEGMRSADDLFYGQVEREARTNGSSVSLRRVMEHPTVAPYIKAQAARPTNDGATDAELFLSAYKRMSEAQRRSLRTQEGTADLMAKIADDAEDIGLAKGLMREASDVAMPTFRTANAVHAANRADISAFENTADAVSRVLTKSRQKGKKILFESPEALEEGIRKMSKSELEAGIEALLGRSQQTGRFTPTPLGILGGLPTAIIRTAMMPSQVNPYLRLMEKQAGRQPRLFDNPVVAERAFGATARTLGGLLSDR